MAATHPSDKGPQKSRPTAKGGLLRYLLIAAVVLLGTALLMRLLRPAPSPEVYNPPPAPVKTVSDIEKQIKDVKNNNHIPEGQKPRILGFLQGDLQKAKAAQIPTAAK